MLDTPQDVTVVGAASGETLNVMGAPMIVKSDGGRIGLYIADHPVPPGYFVPPHIHDTDDEAFYILEGELSLTGPSGETKACLGDCVLLPHGVMHGFRNDTDRVTRLLVIRQPGLQAVEMFRHFDRMGRSPAGLQPQTIGDIAARYGVRML